MFSFLASYERVILENALQGNTDVDRVLRTGILEHDAFAFATSYVTYLLLLPITLACVVGLYLPIAGTRLGGGHRPVHFDALDTISLITAAACGQLALDKAAQAGVCGTGERQLGTGREAHLRAGTPRQERADPGRVEGQEKDGTAGF